MNIAIICPKISRSDGIGRIANSIIDLLTARGITVKVLTVNPYGFWGRIQRFSYRYQLGFLFDLGFVFFSSVQLKTRYRDYKSIAPSHLCPISTDQIHFTSCNFHSLKVSGGLWKLFLSPSNLVYTFIEFILYKNCNQAIFISEQQFDQYKTYYGNRKKESKVIYPVLSDGCFPGLTHDYYFGENLFKKGCSKALFIGYDFRMKGLDIARKAAEHANLALDVVGVDGRYDKGSVLESERFLGAIEFPAIDWSGYGFLLFPSHSDAYALVVQEAFRNGLIPICSSQAGGSEVLVDVGLSDCVVSQPAKKDVSSEQFLSVLYSDCCLDYRNKGIFDSTDFLSSKIYNQDEYISDVLLTLLS